MSNSSKENEPTLVEKRRSSRSKNFWIALGFVAVALGVYVGVGLCKDKPLKIAPATSVDSMPDYEHGQGLDFRQLLDLRQAEACLPAKENGWRVLLENFGPSALDMNSFEDGSWEDYVAGNVDSEWNQKWFNETWKPLCEKFELDPNARPLMYGRFRLVPYLCVNGISGDEPLPTTDDENEVDNSQTADKIPNPAEAFLLAEAPETVKLAGVEYPARVSRSEANDCYIRLMKAPWTAEEFPVAARWLEENADAYDVYIRAVKSPKFDIWRFVDDSYAAFINSSLYDVQTFRNIGRLFKIRANYRIGEGDISGAIDDVETILAYGKTILDSEQGVFVCGLTGVAILSTAASIGFYSNLDAQPNEEERARIDAIWNEFASYDVEAAYERVRQGEYVHCFLPALQDVVRCRRDGGTFELMTMDPETFSWTETPNWIKSTIRLFQPFVAPFDDAKFMRKINEYWEATSESESTSLDELTDLETLTRQSREEKMAYKMGGLLLPAFSACHEAYSHVLCAFQIEALTNAALAYQADNGALPPAFTVDASGKPLHSWRVLILPYLGDDAKALYDKIKLDEPWDSEYNRQFYSSMPSVFRCPSNKDLQPDETAYSAIVGDESLFDASGVGKDLSKLLAREDFDTIKQALIVERSQGVCWMRPDGELTAQEVRDSLTSESKAPCDSFHSGGLQVGLASGAFAFVSRETNPRFSDKDLSAREWECKISGKPVPEDAGSDASLMEHGEEDEVETPETPETSVDAPESNDTTEVDEAEVSAETEPAGTTPEE